MDQKRILVFTENYLPSVGGLENNTLLLCKTLTKLGHVVTLITPQKQALKSSEFAVVESKKSAHYFQYVKANDLVIVNGGIAFKIVIPCLIIKKTYYIIYQMASLFKQIHSDSLKVKLTNWIRKCLARKAKLNIAVSKYSYQELQHYFGKNKSQLLINPSNPIFENRISNELNKVNFNCLFAGRLIEGKGIRLLIEAIEILRAENLPFNLHVIGEGPEEFYIKSKLHLGYIYIYPPTNPEGLRERYKIADLTVIPSTTHLEGSPLVMAESISMGIPVLVSSQPAMIASINHQKLIFKSNDVVDLSNKLKELIDNKVYKEVIKQTLNLARDYSYENYVIQLEKIIGV
jgi:glycosyltransferase involved in cell wall biosynthesis